MEIQTLLYLTTFIAIVALALGIFAVSRYKLLHAKWRMLSTRIDNNELLSNELQGQIEQKVNQHQAEQKYIDEKLVEFNQVSQQLEHRIKLQQEKVESLQAQLDEYQQRQPEDKLYSRAQKMVRLGADVEELVSECQLPRAEAEILIAMYKRQR